MSKKLQNITVAVTCNVYLKMEDTLDILSRYCYNRFCGCKNEDKKRTICCKHRLTQISYLINFAIIII